MSRSFVLLVVSGICWGTGGITGRTLAEIGGISAPAVAAYRLLIGGALLVLTLNVHRRLPRRAAVNAAASGAMRAAAPRGAAAWRRVTAVAALAAIFQASYFSAVAVSSAMERSTPWAYSCATTSSAAPPGSQSPPSPVPKSSRVPSNIPSDCP